MRGPIDYIVVGFQGNKFTGEIIEELEKAVDAGTIAVLDMAVVSKDGEGNVAAIELASFGSGDPFDRLNIEGGLVDDQDVDEIGEMLEDNSSAGLLIIEHLWAKGLKQALLNANGELLAEGRIHPDAAADLDEGGK